MNEKDISIEKITTRKRPFFSEDRIKDEELILNKKDLKKIRKRASESAKAIAKTPEFKDIIIRGKIEQNKRLDAINEYMDHMYIDKDDYDKYKNEASYIMNNIYDEGFVDGYKSKELSISPVFDPELIKKAGMTDTQKLIEEITTALKDLLFYKNENYGDSALHPEKGFSKLDAAEGILVRLNDKYSRIKNNKESPRKNDIVDFMGYLTLYCAAMGWVNFDEFKD